MRSRFACAPLRKPRVAASRDLRPKLRRLNATRRPVEHQQSLEVIVAADVVSANAGQVAFACKMRVTAKRERYSVRPIEQFRFEKRIA